MLIGILVGIEREHRRKYREVFAGVRTFAITSITGMLSIYVAEIVGLEFLLITTAFFALLCIFLAYAKNIIFNHYGLTSPIALFSTYILGILVAKGYFLFAIVGAVVITFLLIEKKPLHSFAENLSEDDILSAVHFLAVAFILYPLVPDQPVFGVLNLKSAILIVVLVSAISFISYVFLKKFGTHGGVYYSGILSGFVNSEASAGAFASIAKHKPALLDVSYIGILLSNTAMLVRNIIIAVIVDPSGRTALLMLPPHLAIIGVSSFTTLSKRKNIKSVDEHLELSSPFALGPAFKFGAGFTILLIVAKFANDIAGATGIYATAIGGLVSSAAVTVSVTTLAVNGGISFTTAAETAVIASIISTLNKNILINLSGTKQLFDISKYTYVLLVMVGFVALVIWAVYLRVSGFTF
ncbi:MgtC/SapB family protein [Methanohalobium evestigatum]|uniref:MgtC/SapB family protein n=1 Tax=Methanohalobium evestigatum TaxID=2322 RepID=UPI001E36E6FC|nr:MgtC/SapB family protein [Methanohalobium evestigatum]